MTGKEWQGLLCSVLICVCFFIKQILTQKWGFLQCFMSSHSLLTSSFLLFPLKSRLLLVWLHQQAGWGTLAGLPFQQGLGVDAPGSLGRVLRCSHELVWFHTDRNILVTASFFLLFYQSLWCFVVYYMLFFHWRKRIRITESHLRSFTITKLEES